MQKDTYATVIAMANDAQQHEENSSEERILAQRYYSGDPTAIAYDTGRSSLVSRDVRDQIKKILPSIERTLLGSEKIVEYQPIGPGDEEAAQQATDYVNYVVMGRIDGHKVLFDAIHDALLLRNGIVKAYIDERTEVSFSEYRNITEQELVDLLGEEGVELVEYSQAGTVQIPTNDPQIPVLDVPVYDAKLKRTEVKADIKADAVPRERFLIHPDAESLETSMLTGERCTLMRSDLVAMGYDKNKVDQLPSQEQDDIEEDLRRDTVDQFDEVSRANDPIDYWELYVRIDMDGDGISELRRIVFAGRLASDSVLEDEEVDEIPYADLTAMPQPHQWEGMSVYDDTGDIQRAKTHFLRQAADNIQAANNPQPVVQPAAVIDMQPVMNPKFGQPIELEEGYTLADAIDWHKVPMVADQAFAMLGYLGEVLEDRSGITDAASGLAPEALQNMTATASAIANQAGIGQTESMVRNLARGIRRFFQIILKLVIRNADKEEVVRLRDKWVSFDPAAWNADMDVTVNVGLGAGTRERDMAVMQIVMGLQEKFIAGFGADNPFVKPENIWNTLSRLVEAAGLKSPDMYFTQPDPQDVARAMSRNQEKADPALEKIKAQTQLEHEKLQISQVETQLRMQADAAKERAQMEADLQVERARIEADTVRQQNELQSKAVLQGRDLQAERGEHEDRMELEWAKLGQQSIDRRMLPL